MINKAIDEIKEWQHYINKISIWRGIISATCLIHIITLPIILIFCMNLKIIIPIICIIILSGGASYGMGYYINKLNIHLQDITNHKGGECGIV